MASTPITSVVIIGGSYTGSGLAIELLKSPNVKVTIINPSASFYFNIAAPRILARPAENPLSKVLLSLPKAFEKYPAKNFEFIVGTVTSVDFSGKVVSVGPSKTVSYDYLVIASGSTTPSTLEADAIPFKSTGREDLKPDLEKAQQLIAAANTIVLGGAGPVGVETAGEIAEAYPTKKVTLVSATEFILPVMKQSGSVKGETNLKGLGVEILKSTKVESAEKTAEGWNVVLSNGTTLKPDLYISAMGVIPNTSFMDKQYLDGPGYIKVDPTFKVEGVTDGSVFAIGDVTTYDQRYLIKTSNHIPVVAANVKAAIAGTPLTPYKPDTKVMIFVPTGAKSGTGQVGGFVLWSFLVTMVKGKDFLMSKAGSYIGMK